MSSTALMRAWLAGRAEPGYVATQRTCARCRRRLPVQRYQGRPRKWCSETCRVAAWRERRRADTDARDNRNTVNHEGETL